MSKPIPRKVSVQAKMLAKPIIPLWPRATWVPDKENSVGEKTRSLKLTLSTEPGIVNGKTLTKSFKIFRNGTPEEWILWRMDLEEICVGMSIVSGSNRNRMVRQLLSDEPLKEFERKLATLTSETNANCNIALDAVALQIFPNNAYAKEKKYLRQGMWKPKVLSIRNVYTRICELNQQLISYPHQSGLLPDDEMKSAFINICLPDWQQEFLKTGINEYSSTWEDILTKAEALETAEAAVVEMTTTKDDKREYEEGEIAPATKPSPKKKAKASYFCKMHGAGQNHNTDTCKVILAQIERLKQTKRDRNPSSFGNTSNNQQSAKPAWSDKKRPATSYSTEQMKTIVRMTKKKVAEDAKTKYDALLSEELNAIDMNQDAIDHDDKMHTMELFVNNLIDDDDTSAMEEEGDEITEADIQELTSSFA